MSRLLLLLHRIFMRDDRSGLGGNDNISWKPYKRFMAVLLGFRGIMISVVCTTCFEAFGWGRIPVAFGHSAGWG